MHMRKFTSTFLIVLLLFLTPYKANAVPNSNTFKEGVYKVSDFNFSEDNLHYIQNISEKGSLLLQIYDKDQIAQQAIRLPPKSQKFNLISLKPEHRIVIIGDGEAYIS